MMFPFTINDENHNHFLLDNPPSRYLQEGQEQFDPNMPVPQQDMYQQGQNPDPQFIDPNMPQQLPYYVPNAEKTFYNDILDKFQGFAGGEISGATDVDVSDAMTSFGFNATIFVFLIVVYEIVSRLVPSVYAGRKFHVTNDRVPVTIEGPTSCLPFSWMPSVLRTNWNTVRKCGGLDAYFFLRFIRMCLKITAVSGLWGMIVLWPIFGSGGNNAEGWYHFSMANVRRGSPRIWGPTLFMWFLVS